MTIFHGYVSLPEGNRFHPFISHIKLGLNHVAASKTYQPFCNQAKVDPPSIHHSYIKNEEREEHEGIEHSRLKEHVDIRH